MQGIIFSLSSFNPHNVLLYKWGYSWGEIKQFYIQKQKEQAEHANSFAEFLVSLTESVLKCFTDGSSNSDATGMDAGEGIEELTQEQLAEWKDILGDSEFERIYGQYL